jgi:glucose/arabinose dehydrogenase
MFGRCLDVNVGIDGVVLASDSKVDNRIFRNTLVATVVIVFDGKGAVSDSI